VCDEGGNRDCMVVGTGGLRVVDASIIRLPLGAHYQATVYVLAENATDSIYAVFCVGVIAACVRRSLYNFCFEVIQRIKLSSLP